MGAVPIDPETTASSAPDGRPPTAGSPGTVHRGRTGLLIGLLVLAASSIAWFRMPSGVAGWLYAEDGKQFVADWASADAAGGISVLWTPYAGYEHLIPRLASLFVTAVLPVTWWATAINVIACLMVGAVAGLVFVLSRDVIADLPCRVVLALITVATPMAATEALGNVANLHWFLLYLTPWLLLATPRSTWGAWGLVAAAFVSTTTEPQCAIFLPLALWRVIRLWPPDTAARRWVIPVLVSWLLGVTAQVLATLTAPRGVGDGDLPPFASVVQGYVLNVGMTIGTADQPVLGAVFLRFGWWAGFIGVAAILALAAIGCVKGGTQQRVVLLALIYGSVVSWTASFVLGQNPIFYYSEIPVAELGWPLLTRWGTAASMLLAATIPVAIAVLIRRHPRHRWVWTTMLAALVAVFAVNLFVDTGPDTGSWAAEVERARAVCDHSADGGAGTVVLTTPPGAGWIIDLPCAVLTE